MTILGRREGGRGNDTRVILKPRRERKLIPFKGREEGEDPFFQSNYTFHPREIITKQKRCHASTGISHQPPSGLIRRHYTSPLYHRGLTRNLNTTMHRNFESRFFHDSLTETRTKREREGKRRRKREIDPLDAECAVNPDVTSLMRRTR